MGEVYRAKDTRLNRDVALKVLPEIFASDPDRMARFEREARVLGALNHPNIAAIYGLEEFGSGRALVMELVEGLTLADRIAKAPIPLDEALPIAKQIAEALEYAHDRGVIHRDLKPANIKVTVDGTVKVLDFGLAKALLDEPVAADPRDSPTLSMAPTMAGVILGTAAYMSPEQAKGKPVDRRADIWAFGVVLFEMLTGKQPFTGETAAETLASVMKEEPTLEALPRNTPPPIRHLLRRCLEKNLRQRLQHIGEARIVIEAVVSGSAAAEPVAGQRQRLFGWVATTVAAVLLVALATLSFIHFRETPPQRSSIRFQIAPPGNGTISVFRLSPNGRQLVIVANQSGQNQLWVRSLDSADARPLAGTDGATYPFWSPDSTQIAFFAQGKLKRIAVTGGPALTICQAPNGRGGAWNRDGVIIFAPELVGGLQRVADSGGLPVLLTNSGGDSGASDRFPNFLPGGRRFLFYRESEKESGIFVGSADGVPPVRILPDESNAEYIGASGANGYLIFRRESTLLAESFDSEHLQVTGMIIPIAEQVSTAANLPYGAFSAANDGTLAYATGFRGNNRQLVWLDRTGKSLGVIGKPGEIGNPILAPNGETVAFIIGNTTAGSADIWLQDLKRGTISRFTFGPRANGYPIWSPDSRSIVFTAQPGVSNYYLHQKLASGAGSADVVWHSPWGSLSADDWSADGKFIVFSARSEKTKDDLWLLPMKGDRNPIPFLQSPASETHGQFSPDGTWMAYQSDESGRNEVYVQHVPTNGMRFQISSTGGTDPRWGRDSKELFYLAPGPKLMVVAVKAGATFDPGQTRVLFENIPFVPSTIFGGFSFQPSPDGQRFLALVQAQGEGPASPITVVVNWAAGLKK
jgi:eukaryotic-like serine/threonine-protein kinase